MNTKKKAPPQGAGHRMSEFADGSRQQQDMINSRVLQYQTYPEQYRRTVLRLFADAYVMFKGWPAQMRISCYVDRNGSLRCLTKGGTGS